VAVAKAAALGILASRNQTLRRYQFLRTNHSDDLLVHVIGSRDRLISRTPVLIDRYDDFVGHVLAGALKSYNPYRCILVMIDEGCRPTRLAVLPVGSLAFVCSLLASSNQARDPDDRKLVGQHRNGLISLCLRLVTEPS
jgi:hypothetical protein